MCYRIGYFLTFRKIMRFRQKIIPYFFHPVLVSFDPYLCRPFYKHMDLFFFSKRFAIVKHFFYIILGLYFINNMFFINISMIRFFYIANFIFGYFISMVVYDGHLVFKVLVD